MYGSQLPSGIQKHCTCHNRSDTCDGEGVKINIIIPCVKGGHSSGETVFSHSATKEVENLWHWTEGPCQSLLQTHPEMVIWWDTVTDRTLVVHYVGPNMVWCRQVNQHLDAPTGDVTAQPAGSDTPQDSKDTLKTPDCATVNSDTQIPETVDSTPQCNRLWFPSKKP